MSPSLLCPARTNMQTLRFYTRRVFLLVCLLFVVSLLFMASRNGPQLDSRRLDPGAPLTADEEKDQPIMADYKARQDWRRFRPSPLRLLDVNKRPGEQLHFQPQPPPALDNRPVEYSDLQIARPTNSGLASRIRAHLRQLPRDQLEESGCKRNTTLAQYWLETQGRIVPTQDSWEQFYSQIGSCELYHEDDVIGRLLDDLSKLPIKHVGIMEGGTQVKLIFTFDNDKQAVFKPMRFGRDYETDPNHFYFGDFERHNAEIATFHLDRILGYRRAVPTVGRVVNITSLMEKAERRLRKTFFISPAKNWCFVSKCDYYCDTTHAICASPDLKEGSVQVFLPDDTSVPRKHNKSPYRRTYSKKTQLAVWQQDIGYCESKVKVMRQYAHGRRLLDLVDLHLMDYLIGNQDRHHYETFSVFGDIPSYAIHLDNGRSFGKTVFDDDDILMPLRQCCVIRPGTLAILFHFYTAKKGLSETLHDSLSKDPIFPVLAFKHYPALERRLHNIMRYLLECLDKVKGQQGGIQSMVVSEFHNPLVPEPLPGEEQETEEDETNANQQEPAAAGPPAQAAPAEDGNNNAQNVLKAPPMSKMVHADGEQGIAAPAA